MVQGQYLSFAWQQYVQFEPNFPTNQSVVFLDLNFYWHKNSDCNDEVCTYLSDRLSC